MGPKLRICLLACCFLYHGAKQEYARLSVRPRQRLYTRSVRLHPHRCVGMTAPKAYAARRCQGNCPQPPILACFAGGWGRVLAPSSYSEWRMASVMHRFPEPRHSCMYAAVTAVFDVSWIVQSQISPVEAYTVAEYCYSALDVSTRTHLQLTFSLASTLGHL